MEKKPFKEYSFEDENSDNDILREPAIQYERQPVTELKGSPPLSEEELKECITREELLEAVYAHIDELFNRKK